jgi:hypothetical protein
MIHLSLQLTLLHRKAFVYRLLFTSVWIFFHTPSIQLPNAVPDTTRTKLGNADDLDDRINSDDLGDVYDGIWRYRWLRERHEQRSQKFFGNIGE